jgi:hypothetical protein
MPKPKTKRKRKPSQAVARLRHRIEAGEDVAFTVLNPQTERGFIPLPAQKEFGRASSFATFLAGGWSAQKTWGLLEWIRWSIKLNRGVMGLLLLPQHKHVLDFMSNIFRPAFRLNIARESKAENLVHFTDGSSMKYLSGFDPSVIEGFTGGWACADEAGLMDRITFSKMTARCRDPRAPNPRVALTGVPIWGWLKEEFDKRRDSQRQIMHVSTYANPYTSAVFKRNLMANCPASQRKMYIEGEFVPPGSQILPEYSAHHMIDYHYTGSAQLHGLPQEVGRVQTELCCLIDWSPRHPKVVFIEKLPAGVLIPYHGPVRGLIASPFDPVVGGLVTTSEVGIVIDEIQPDGASDPVGVEDLGRQILARGYRLDKIIADRAGNAVEQTSLVTAVEQMEAVLRQGIQFVPTKLRGIVAGIEHVRLALEPAFGHPRLFFVMRLAQERHPRGVVNSIIGYTYAKDKDGVLSDLPRSDNLTEDSMDLLRYWCITELAAPRLIAQHISGSVESPIVRR